MRSREVLRRHFLIRRYEAGDLLETFMVSAVTALLLIRFFLKVTGYPQLGGAQLHIAHLLWGGLLMMAAIVILLVSISRLPVHLAAVVGGVGFGMFIDELGKFITSDNDYFFEPTIALIYGLFVLLYIVFRAVGRYTHTFPQADLVNALELTKEAVIKDLDEDEKRHALSFLARCDQDAPLVRTLTDVLRREQVVAPFLLPPATHVRSFVDRRWRAFLVSPRFTRVLHAAIVACVLVALAEGFLSVRPQWRHLTTAAWGQLLSSVLIAGLVILGFFRLRRSRAAGYRQFLRGALLSIFVTQVFAFYREQLKAIAGLVISIALWLLLREVLVQEERARESPSGKP